MEVSVVICTHALDMYDHFSEAVDSVLAQTYAHVELVIIVDGTSKVYDQAVDDYGDRDDTMVECNDENVGLLASRNRGAKLSSGDVVAFIDDDAVADEQWIELLVQAYENKDAIAVGGEMIPDWVAGKPMFLPEEFYWLVGVTHRGFAERQGEVRNTFGSNISFRREVFVEMSGFDTGVGGRQGDMNLQGGETELCVRMRSKYGQGVWYEPEAKVAHKVFHYRTNITWLFDRALWQGYSKHIMSQLVEENSVQEQNFARRLLFEFGPNRAGDLLRSPSLKKISQFVMFVGLTIAVSIGYLYGMMRC
jgi:glycosyltransferase involved in cell wall biosynthesis